MRAQETHCGPRYSELPRADKGRRVAAAGVHPEDSDSWDTRIGRAREDVPSVPHAFPPGTGLRYGQGDWDALPHTDPPAPATAAVEVPAMFARPAPLPPAVPTTLSPSDLGGAKALPGEDGQDADAAMARGSLIHRLLEVLPDLPANRHAPVMDAILAGAADDAAIRAEVAQVLSAPHLAHVFAPDTLAEVTVTSPIAGQRVHGAIDRLRVTDTEVLAVDFKTNAVVPATPRDCPEGLLRQMGAYVLALQAVYPDRPVRVAILWSRTADLMHLPHDLVTAAAFRSPRLDGAEAGS